MAVETVWHVCEYCGEKFGAREVRSHQPKCRKQKEAERKEFIAQAQRDRGKLEQREAVLQRMIAELRRRWPNKSYLWLKTKALRELAHRESQPA